MSEPIEPFNEKTIKNELRELVRQTVEGTLNGLVEGEAGDLTGAGALQAHDGESAPTTPSSASTARSGAGRLRKPSGHVGTYRERLLRADVIGEPDRNVIDFELSGFRDFLWERLGTE